MSAVDLIKQMTVHARTSAAVQNHVTRLEGVLPTGERCIALNYHHDMTLEELKGVAPFVEPVLKELHDKMLGEEEEIFMRNQELAIYSCMFNTLIQSNSQSELCCAFRQFANMVEEMGARNVFVNYDDDAWYIAAVELAVEDVTPPQRELIDLTTDSEDEDSDDEYENDADMSSNDDEMSALTMPTVFRQ